MTYDVGYYQTIVNSSNAPSGKVYIYTKESLWNNNVVFCTEVYDYLDGDCDLLDCKVHQINDVNKLEAYHNNIVSEWQ